MSRIYEALNNIQTTLKAKKGQYNDYGGYDYRSCEDILGALKGHLTAQNVVVTLTDEIVMVGDRYYVKATASLYAAEDKTDCVSVTAYAREAADKKGMDVSQVTGSASSYARKYALNGLFAIDDTKDADTNEYRRESTGRVKTAEPSAPVPAPAPAPVVAKCADCGKDIEGRGKYTPEAIAKKTHKTYGRMLCWECAERANEERKAKGDA